jgi:hypothetical protein
VIFAALSSVFYQAPGIYRNLSLAFSAIRYKGQIDEVLSGNSYTAWFNKK